MSDFIPSPPLPEPITHRGNIRSWEYYSWQRDMLRDRLDRLAHLLHHGSDGTGVLTEYGYYSKEAK